MRFTLTAVVSDLLQYHSQRQNAFLEIDETVVIGPEFLQRIFDVRQVIGQ